MHRRHLFRIAALGTVAGIVTACTSDTAQSNADSALNATIAPTNPAAGASRGLTLAIASSLEHVIDAFIDVFLAQTDFAEPQVQAGSSNALAQQIVAGAAFDIFCAADRDALAPLVEAEIVGPKDAFPIATTTLVVIAQPRLAMKSITDVRAAGTKIVVCDPAVPLGRYTDQLWASIVKRTGDKTFRSDIEARTVSYEDKATAVVQKFFGGDADVAVVYASDLVGHDTSAYTVLELPGAGINTTVYALRLPQSTAESAAFLNLMSDPQQAAIWQAHGFTQLS
jgi:molybdate transport system substrate-binding protein